MLDRQKLHVAHRRGRNPQLSTQDRNSSAIDRNFPCNSESSNAHTYAIQYATGDATILQPLCNFSGVHRAPKVALRNL